MKKLLLILVSVAMFGISCEQENDEFNNASKSTYNPIYSNWKLIKIEGGFHLQNFNGEITWNIQSESNHIEVSILNNVENPFLPLGTSGYYIYDIYGDTLQLSNGEITEKLHYKIDENFLFLDEDLSACGKRYTFIRE